MKRGKRGFFFQVLEQSSILKKVNDANICKFTGTRWANPYHYSTDAENRNYEKKIPVRFSSGSLIRKNWVRKVLRWEIPRKRKEPPPQETPLPPNREAQRPRISLKSNKLIPVSQPMNCKDRRPPALLKNIFPDSEYGTPCPE